MGVGLLTTSFSLLPDRPTLCRAGVELDVLGTAGDAGCAGFGLGEACVVDCASAPVACPCGAVADGTYGWPNSPAENARVEQKPSEELMMRVSPSVDLSYRQQWVVSSRRKWYAHHVKSVNVAKCRLLTTHNGVCCCVSYTNTASCVATAYTIR